MKKKTAGNGRVGKNIFLISPNENLQLCDEFYQMENLHYIQVYNMENQQEIYSFWDFKCEWKNYFSLEFLTVVCLECH